MKIIKFCGISVFRLIMLQKLGGQIWFVVDKKERSCKIIDLAVPGDGRIEEKEKHKMEEYQVLGRELQKIWNVKVNIIPLVAGSCGAIPKQFGKRLSQIGITVRTAQVQKKVLL